jgi:hypothetical protein
MKTTNIVAELLEHYTRLYIRALIADKTEESKRYLSVLASIHHPTYLAVKALKKSR